MTARGGKRPAILAGAGAAVVLAVAIAAFFVVRDDGGTSTSTTLAPDQAGAQRAADAFATAVTTGLPGDGGTVQPAAEVNGEFLPAVEGLGAVSLEATVGSVEVAGDAGTAMLETIWTVGGSSWSTPGTLDLVRIDSGGDGTWQSRWSLSALDDRLRPGDLLAADRTDPTRGTVLAAGGEELAGASSVIVVGVEPQRATDVPALTAELARLLDIDAEALAARIASAAPDAFVEVITLREDAYGLLRDQLQPLPGTVFRRDEQSLAVSRTFASAVLGQVEPATSEQVAESDGRIQPGQVTGVGGIQQAYDGRLAGTPGLEVTVTRAPVDDGAPDGSASSSSAPATSAPAGTPEVLETIPPVDGQPVTTSLEVGVQEAAEAALVGQTTIASLVAIRPSTGAILADANINNGGFDYGARAHVPPGSTLKVVRTTAHLRKGLTPEQIVPCPQTINVGGREFKNFEDFALGDVPFSEDFAQSCNTAFAGLADQLAPTDLTDAAASFGIGVEWTTGIPTYTGSVPNTEGIVGAAASSLGQGRIVVSPLDMAGVASTVASGRWRAPTLVTDPPVEIPEERPLAPGEPDVLSGLMRGVVTDGSAGALEGLPGDPVMAKTGTA
ncbi:penicillin-binding transpeptidase domain-containing protein [soil metagenome]